MAETIKDKHLYAYKKALEEQNTFHTIFGYPLLSPIKFVCGLCRCCATY